VEKNLVNFALSIDGSNWLFKVSDVPEIEGFVLASGGQILSIGGNGDSVDLILVGFESVSDLEISIPDLKSSVPAD